MATPGKRPADHTKPSNPPINPRVKLDTTQIDDLRGKPPANAPGPLQPHGAPRYPKETELKKKLSKEKAKKILDDGEVRGKPLTGKQKRLMGAVSKGAKPYAAADGAVLIRAGLDELRSQGAFPPRAT